MICSRKSFAFKALLVAGGLLCNTVNAADCWVDTLHNPQTGTGEDYSAPRYSGWRHTLETAENLLRKDDHLNRINPVRFQLHQYIGQPDSPGLPLSASSSLFFHDKQAWKGQCELQEWADRLHFASISLTFNSLRSVIEANGGALSGDAPPFILLPETTGSNQGIPIWQDRWVILTPNNLPAFVPLTYEEYIDWWLSYLSQERNQWSEDATTLSEEEREWQNYINEVRRSDPKQAEELEKMMEEATRVELDDHTGEWAEIQRLKAGINNANRHLPVYLDVDAGSPYRFSFSLTASETARPLVQVNNALWQQGANSNAVKVVVIDAYVNGKAPFEPQGEQHKSVAVSWLYQFNPNPYLALLSK
ncbi:hypothetical protein P2G88_18990 [Aliiglaciecola sp. CAU 1673]|uniref:hypothetical protein n=1 Tax=Aliiglaciecola sp. CAU 1673 TaxID=3032595 RepID=UPI0023D9DB29|nr:hypothetical protein [Aliiglaciecola sp. CAU 1673]MDF2180349.1 hypothetical protein [Aliiglaciecola sp. CAU 1673]